MKLTISRSRVRLTATRDDGFDRGVAQTLPLSNMIQKGSRPAARTGDQKSQFPTAAGKVSQSRQRLAVSFSQKNRISATGTKRGSRQRPVFEIAVQGWVAFAAKRDDRMESSQKEADLCSLWSSLVGFAAFQESRTPAATLLRIGCGVRFLEIPSRGLGGTAWS